MSESSRPDQEYVIIKENTKRIKRITRTNNVSKKNMAGQNTYWSDLAVIAADDLIEWGNCGIDFDDSQLFVRSYVVACWEKSDFSVFL